MTNWLVNFQCQEWENETVQTKNTVDSTGFLFIDKVQLYSHASNFRFSHISVLKFPKYPQNFENFNLNLYTVWLPYSSKKQSTYKYVK